MVFERSHDQIFCFLMLCCLCLTLVQVAQSQNKVYLCADSLVLNLQDKDSFK